MDRDKNVTASFYLQPPNPPSNLSATAVSQTQINLSWSDNSNNEDGFKIYRNGSYLTSVGANVTSYQNTKLYCGASYSYYVKAYNAGGESDSSNTASATTHICPPTAPSNLSATAVSQTQINLSWSDNSNNEDGFKVYRNGSYLASVGANVTSYQDTGLSCGTSYSYFVKAYNAGGESSSSNTTSATTYACPPTAPNPPSNLSATAVSQTQINLSWSDNANNEDGFKVYRNGSYLASVGANVSSYQDTGLSCGTIYSYLSQFKNSPIGGPLR